MAVGELRQPRVAEIGFASQVGPLTPMLLDGLNQGCNGVHAHTLAKVWLKRKHFFEQGPDYPLGMDDVKANLAANLARLMKMSADLQSQNALARRSKVAQTTIGNYLAPDTYRGAPSLAMVAKLARAFGLEAWQLIHPTMGDKVITAEELALYRRLRATIKAADSD